MDLQGRYPSRSITLLG